ncbi:LacI family transcriptional regulator [Frondihabitans sucicola]|uniref:LacI family transcriptional regulator n=1 Tax=Frondihabitans sucicola TaxID=1268041 RepID=A0ABM8GNB5_9MICO|nr:LacI family DNA-binding transcriptional regulator [Frondihabitans sucicola]BDZ49728.1 LacI family transcriptional regulator [Frondihabitans sucicola]
MPQKDPPRRSTVRDVAVAAGVSPGTVSKALNRSGQVSDETRARIEQAARELGFRPNELAKSVFNRRSFTVGMITTDSFERFSVPVMLGAEDALGAGRISVFLCDSRDDPIRESHYIEVLLGRRVDGIIVTGRSSNPRKPISVDASTPVVYALTPSSDPDDCSVVVDDVAAGRLAGDHLIGLGRRRIGHITGPSSFDAVRRRAQGLAHALEEAGTTIAGGVLAGSWSEAWGRQAAQILLRSNPDIDAIHCGSDLIARGVTEALRDAGRSIPSDIALSSTDNWQLIAEGARPPLTSIDMNLSQVGQVAAQRLLEAIEGKSQSGIELVTPTLVVRASTDGGV